MAAFSQHQYHPFLVDSSSSSTSSSSFLFPNINSTNNNKLLLLSSSSFEGQDHHLNTSPLQQQHHHQFPLALHHQETCSNVTFDHQASTNPSPAFGAHHNHNSPDSSSIVDVDNGEQQVTPMDYNKRKTTLNAAAASSSLSKDSSEGRRSKKQKRNNNGVGVVKGKEGGPPNHEIEPPTGYIHVRARRGQATDSHSLAERVRREKISERMKMLQRLVPGCDKVTGKALVLDEIINYVQSLQNQVEFLSMKLASLNPLFFDFAMDLDSLLVRPEYQKLNSMASPSTAVATQCSPNEATTYAVDTTTTTTTFPAAASNGDYLLDYSSQVFLQGQRSNVFSEYAGGQLWEVEDQRQKPLHPYGSGNNLCSLN